MTVDLSSEGSYEIYCPIDGHRDSGMEGTLTVGAASTGGSGTSEDEGSTSEDEDSTSEDEDSTTESGAGYGYGSG